jgi:hypothetical protein
MPEVIFDGTDGLDTSAQEAAQAKALEVGEKLIAEQEEAQRDTYERARKAEESELRFAGKFKSAEDLEKAYKELEKKLGQRTDEEDTEESSPESTTEEAESAPEETDEGGEEPSVADLLSKASEEFYSEEGLSEDTLKTLKNLSSEELVDAYVELQRNAAQPESIPNEMADQIIKDYGGGSDAYKQTLEWAADNLSPKEIAAYDHVVSTGSPEAVSLAVQALSLRAKYEGGFEGMPVSGKAVKNQGPKGFKSQAELARAIGDARYRTDPAYRLEIQERLANSGDLL